jgi:hypothetical protein
MWLGLGLGAAILAGACAHHHELVIATDGKTFEAPILADGRLDLTPALLASGAHDLPCPLAQVKLDSDARYAVFGCGWRATYHWQGRSIDGAPTRFELLARSPLTPVP